jgi:hypothetical protein
MAYGANHRAGQRPGDIGPPQPSRVTGEEKETLKASLWC